MTPDGLPTLRVRNSRKHIVSFVLEPWGEIYPMRPDAVYEVWAEGPPGDTLEVETGDDHITVYGWPGSTLWVRDENGNELGGNVGSPRSPVPSSRTETTVS